MKKKLQAMKIQYAMLYPARLTILHGSKPRIFTTPTDAMQFIKQLERREATRMAGDEADNED